MLTDGGVGNTDNVLQLIDRNAWNCTVYALGIGSGVSAELITGAAGFGKGKYEFVSQMNLIDEKVILLLKASLAKKYYNFWFEFNKDHVDKIVPDPSSLTFLRENEPF